MSVALLNNRIGVSQVQGILQVIYKVGSIPTRATIINNKKRVNDEGSFIRDFRIRKS